LKETLKKKKGKEIDIDIEATCEEISFGNSHMGMEAQKTILHWQNIEPKRPVV
jgi:hypothetical protein